MFNYIGEIINDYKVLDVYQPQKGARSLVKCECLYCGEIRDFQRNYVNEVYKTKNPDKMICPYHKSRINIGDKYGRLTVIKPDTDNKDYGRLKFICECECGNITSIKAKDLLSGNKKSCGCLATEHRLNNLSILHQSLEDLTGKQSGYLTILREATPNESNDRPKGLRYWYCECICGNHHIVSTSDFNHSKVQSCGCMNSKGEAAIRKLLEQYHYNYATQYYFNDLQNNGRYYRFDFGILTENGQLLYLIEYDGIQHRNPKCQFTNDEQQAKELFNKITDRDNIKNQYCVEHSIPLIRIPDTHLDLLTIEDLDLNTTKFRI